MPRRLLAAGRVLLWGAVALVWIRGALSLLPGGTPGPAPAQAQVAAASFPQEAGTAVALQFAQEYLTFGEGAADRTDRLAPFLPKGAEAGAGWDGRGTQQVSAVVPVGVSALGPRAAVVTVATRAGERWLHLAVPLRVEHDRIVVGDLPAFVPGPWAAEAVEPSGAPADPGRTAEVGPALESFFRAYAGGSPADLTYFATPGRTVAGLGGAVTFAGLVELRVGEGARSVPAAARVRWTDPASGAGFTQSYRMTLVARDGRWYVDRLGTGPAPSGKEA